MHSIEANNHVQRDNTYVCICRYMCPLQCCIRLVQVLVSMLLFLVYSELNAGSSAACYNAHLLGYTAGIQADDSVSWTAIFQLFVIQKCF